ncbi:Glutamate 5-kinase [Posidoniimonas corsicana]|uniref:Glutamate 5-kinase n=1 Tax=Posidoniimonas corsicana TaxID=1938618 RepID=A0A5C5VDL5_9BACT|nr:glutamate 5-kinase [Posidoniimonas corsicana]TWT36047.1 Glutamate 5-kinase [Posidoniimonas corsicana]
MLDAVRNEIAAIADMVVVKVGTRTLTGPDGALDLGQIKSIADQIARLRADGRKVVLVSSGAVGAGIGRLGLTERPTDLAQLQAAAAVGQSCLIECYNQALEPHGLHAAQVLLTADDMHDRRRYLNARNTLRALFDYGAVPIVNENDTVRVEELRRSMGDNDRLAALVTNLIRAPLMVLLTDVEGLYDGDPSVEGSKVIPIVRELDKTVMGLAGESNHAGVRLSTGGMSSKLKAVKISTEAGENVVIANGRRPNVLPDILAGESIGTLFIANGASVRDRKRWIGWSVHPEGKLRLDAGAEHAIAEEGGSLLAVGITAVEGEFDKGDVVSLVGPNGEEFARGQTNYSSKDVRQVAGEPTERFSEILGKWSYYEVVHRDNLTLLRA